MVEDARLLNSGLSGQNALIVWSLEWEEIYPWVGALLLQKPSLLTHNISVTNESRGGNVTSSLLTLRFTKNAKRLLCGTLTRGARLPPAHIQQGMQASRSRHNHSAYALCTMTWPALNSLKRFVFCLVLVSFTVCFLLCYFCFVSLSVNVTCK